MTTQRDILQAVEDLPPAALEQVKDFILFLKKTKRQRRPPLKESELVKRQVAAIKKWAGKNLRPGFSGREHDAILYGGER